VLSHARVYRASQRFAISGSHRIHEQGLHRSCASRLPGHGTNRLRTFWQLMRDDWVEAGHATRILISVPEYEEVVIVLGFFYGRADSLQSSRHNIRLEKLILVAPAFQVFAKNLWLDTVYLAARSKSCPIFRNLREILRIQKEFMMNITFLRIQKMWPNFTKCRILAGRASLPSSNS
jgi:pimeloyl-ACP methyl ester carboxylesterase